MLREKLQTPTPPPDADKPSSASSNGKRVYKELMLGVWRVLVAKDAYFSPFTFHWEDHSTKLALLHRALCDVYAVSPRLFALFVLVHTWNAIEDPLSLYFSNRLFFFIGKRISGDLPHDRIPVSLYLAVISRIACSVLSAYIRQAAQRIRNAYTSRIKYEFQSRIFSGETGITLVLSVLMETRRMLAKLACDLQTAQEQDDSRVDIEDIYTCLERAIGVADSVISVVLHFRLILHVIGSGLNDGGLIFLAICFLPMLIEEFTPGDLWTKAYMVSVANKFFTRKSSLEKLAKADLRQEVMAGGMNSYLINEYRKAKDGLGDTPDTGPEMLYDQEHQALSDILSRLRSDGPTIYFALLALFNPSKLSVVEFAVLNQTSTSLRYAFSSIQYSVGLWPNQFSRLMNVYTALDEKGQTKDGETAFPRPGYEASVGMTIEVQDVSFSYPNAKSDRAALAGVSFTIHPGQLVVIVGANGSGKSTIIKLLSRFYDPSSGKILIDGIPITEYKMDALRKGIAMLTQEHQLFPLSVRENIQLGASEAEAMEDEKTIRMSMSAAGAEGMVNRFLSGYDTVLEPMMTAYISYAAHGDRELEAMQKKTEKPTSISGGEKQKLVAARTFMRLFTSPVKLVTVDEPSSALDPEAEYRLFTNLRQERRGRTMIFVTHRFGHLTKHADLIICMKEGTVVETGTHGDLLSRGGEYARLYNVQAQAFATTA